MIGGRRAAPAGSCLDSRSDSSPSLLGGFSASKNVYRGGGFFLPARYNMQGSPCKLPPFFVLFFLFLCPFSARCRGGLGQGVWFTHARRSTHQTFAPPLFPPPPPLFLWRASPASARTSRGRRGATNVRGDRSHPLAFTPTPPLPPTPPALSKPRHSFEFEGVMGTQPHREPRDQQQPQQGKKTRTATEPIRWKGKHTISMARTRHVLCERHQTPPASTKKKKNLPTRGGASEGKYLFDFRMMYFPTRP
jgi:hypothetical protein